MGNEALEIEKLGGGKFVPKARNRCLVDKTLPRISKSLNCPETPYEKMKRKQEEAKNNVLENRKEKVEVDDFDENDERDLQREIEDRWEQERSDSYNDNMYNSNI